jgi:hypothetical protein
MKKLVIAVLSILVATGMVCGLAAAIDAPVSVGPAPDSGDGTPSGNLFIQPDAPGPGPAPNCGDGVSDGSGF